jgi:hypothetical protein
MAVGNPSTFTKIKTLPMKVQSISEHFHSQRFFELHQELGVTSFSDSAGRRVFCKDIVRNIHTREVYMVIYIFINESHIYMANVTKISRHHAANTSTMVLPLCVHVNIDGTTMTVDVQCSHLVFSRTHNSIYVMSEFDPITRSVTVLTDEKAAKFNFQHPAVEKSRSSNMDVVVLSLGLFSDETKGTISARANMYETCSLTILNTDFEYTQGVGGTILLTCTNGVKPLPLLNVFMPALRELENGMLLS